VFAEILQSEDFIVIRSVMEFLSVCCSFGNIACDLVADIASKHKRFLNLLVWSRALVSGNTINHAVVGIILL